MELRARFETHAAHEPVKGLRRCRIAPGSPLWWPRWVLYDCAFYADLAPGISSVSGPSACRGERVGRHRQVQHQQSEVCPVAKRVECRLVSEGVAAAEFPSRPLCAARPSPCRPRLTAHRPRRPCRPDRPGGSASRGSSRSRTSPRRTATAIWSERQGPAGRRPPHRPGRRSRCARARRRKAAASLARYAVHRPRDHGPRTLRSLPLGRMRRAPGPGTHRPSSHPRG